MKELGLEPCVGHLWLGGGPGNNGGGGPDDLGRVASMVGSELNLQQDRKGKKGPHPVWAKCTRWQYVASCDNRVHGRAVCQVQQQRRCRNQAA